MSIEFAETIIDIGNKDRAGMYRDFESEIPVNIGKLVRHDGLPRKFRLVRRQTDTGSEEPWEDVNIEDATIGFGLGAADKEPTAGTFALSYNGDATGLAGIAYNVSETVLQAALNANPGIAAGGASVTVKRYKSSYLVTWNQNGARSLIAATVSGLVPQMNTNAVTRLQTGDVANPEAQAIILTARPYAFTTAWIPYIDEGATVTERQAGSATKRAVRVLRFATRPYSGSLIVNFPKPERVKVTAKSNAAVKEVFTVTVGSTAVAANLNSKAFAAGDDVGPVQFWFNYNGTGVAPVVPLGGRNIAIALAVGDTYLAIATKIATTIHGDGKFDATQKANVITVTASAVGERQAPYDIDSNPQGITVSEITPGTSGNLAGKYFRLTDSGGSVGVWFSVGGSAVPEGAAALSRQIEVPILTGDTANQVATKIGTALTADAIFAPVVLANVVTVTDTVGGEREGSFGETSGFTVATVQEGAAVTATIDYNASAEDLERALGSTWKVIKRGYNFTLTAATTGVQPDFDIDATGLVYPNGVQGELNLNTLPMFEAFASTDDDYLTLVFEAKIQFVGQLPYTFYRETVLVYRDVIDLATVQPLATLIVSEVSGNVALPTGAETVAVAYGPLTQPPTKIQLTLFQPAGGGEFFALAVDPGSITNAGFNIMVGGGGAPGAGYKASYVAAF